MAFVGLELGLAPVYKISLNKPFRSFYKKATKHKIEERLHEYVNDRVINLFWNKVAKYLVERRAGVQVDRIGYFFNYRPPFKFVNKQPKLFEFHPTFLPTENSIFKYWMMDDLFNITLEQAIRQRVKKGYKYLNMMNAVNKTNTVQKLSWYSENL